MVQAIARWTTMTGIRRTIPGSTLDVSVVAVTDLNPAGEDGIDRVEFSVVVNGGAPSVTTVSAPSMRQPDYNAVPSPHLGASGGKMAPVYGYGITLDCAVLAPGTIEVSATVYSNAGTATVIDTPVDKVTLYNDTDGGDRRPSKNIVVVSPTGSDTGAGTLGDPASVRRGFNLAANVPGGSSMSDRDAGGAIIVFTAGDYQLFGTSLTAAPIHTSGHWWIECVTLPGVTFTRDHTASNGFMTATGNGSGTHYRVKFTGEALWFHNGPAWSKTAGVDRHIWIEGGASGSELYSEAVPWSVRHIVPTATKGYLTISFDGADATDRRYVTCHTKLSATAGFQGYGWAQDVVYKYMQGVVMQAAGPENKEQTINVHIDSHRAARNAVAGYCEAVVGSNVTLTSFGGGLMALIATGVTRQYILAPNDGEVFQLDTQLGEIVNDPYWRLRLSNFGASNDGDFQVIGVGNVGAPYVLFINPIGSTVTTPGASARIDVIRDPSVDGMGGTYNALVHTDILQVFEGRTDALWYGVSARNLDVIRGYVDSSGTNTRVAFVNCSTGGEEVCSCDWYRPQVDCLFIHCTWDFFFWGVPTAPGTNIVDCQFNLHSGFGGVGIPTDPVAAGMYVTNNHFTSGPAVGANATSGTWFATDQRVSPWSLRPLDANLNGGSGRYPAPVDWQWPNATTDTVGVWQNVGDLDWSSGGSTEVLPFAGGIAIAAPSVSVRTGVSAEAIAFRSSTLLAAPSVSVRTGVGAEAQAFSGTVTFGAPNVSVDTGEAPPTPVSPGAWAWLNESYREVLRRRRSGRIR